MSQDNYFHVRRFELVDRVPQILFYTPDGGSYEIRWQYGTDKPGSVTENGRITGTDVIVDLFAPYPVKPGLSCVVTLRLSNGNAFTGTLHAPPIDKETDAPN